jgi:hypothetical protein
MEDVLEEQDRAKYEFAHDTDPIRLFARLIDKDRNRPRRANE